MKMEYNLKNSTDSQVNNIDGYQLHYSEWKKQDSKTKYARILVKDILAKAKFVHKAFVWFLGAKGGMSGSERATGFVYMIEEFYILIAVTHNHIH